MRNLKELDHCEILKKSFFYWHEKFFEPFRIREKRSHIRPKSGSLGGEGQNLERRIVERPTFRNFKIANNK